MINNQSAVRIGVYVDVSNLSQNGGFGMRFDVLRDFACRGNAEPMRLNVYVAFDRERGERDPAYRNGQYGFHSHLRDFGYKVITKEVRWYQDEDGNRYAKANADLDLAVDALLQSEKLNRVLLATGDGDFVQVVRALQNKGCRVEIVAFDNASEDLRREADLFVSGYLVPNLLPPDQPKGGPAWGEIGSRVRGVCHVHTEKHYGFLRFMKTIGAELWRTDPRQEDSPYQSVFFHDSSLPREVNASDLPSRNVILEFDLVPSADKTKGIQAANIQLVSPRKKTSS